MFVNDLRIGEAVQFHAILNLLSAGLLVGWLAIVPGDGTEGWRVKGGAVLLGTVAGLTTVYVLLTVWSYFAGPFALPVVEQLSDVITIQN